MNNKLSQGDILNSRYRISNHLGQGSFGYTYLAEDINRFNEPCVLKEFAPRNQSDFVIAKAQELFKQEAEVLYRLDNIHIPKFRALFCLDNNDDSRLFLVQDYVEGQTYYNLFHDRYQKGLGFSQAEIYDLLHQLLPVLEYIHSLGVIHRDISPENIMLRSSDGLAMLIDFGCIKDAANKAQSIAQEATQKSLSIRGTILGKTGYAPPEQILLGVVSYHSDLYALAATAMVLLAGKDPQELIDNGSFQWHFQEQLNLDYKLGWVLNKMLSPNPEDRFPNATKAIEALEDVSKVPSALPLTQKLSFINRAKNSNSTSSKIWLYTALLIIGGLGLFSLGLGNKDKFVIQNFISKSPALQKIQFKSSKRFSQGEKILISQVITPAKQQAVIEFAAGNYSKAVSLFEESRQTLPNDPETLIYLNNAVIGKQKAYTIAAVIPVGTNINVAQELLRGVAQVQNQINQKGGINGTPLKVMIANDDDSPKIGKQIATQLSKDPQILGVVGHYSSKVNLAVAKIYESDRLVVVTPTSTSVRLTNLSPYMFKATPNDYIASRAMTKYAIEELAKKKVAIFYSSQSIDSQTFKSELATAITLEGGSIVREFDLSRNDFSAAQSIQKSIDRDAQVLMLAVDFSTLDKALQVVHLNRNKLNILAGDALYAHKTLEIAGEFAQKMVIAVPWHIENAHPDSDFVKVASQLWRGKVSWRTAKAYDATIALVTALEKNPTRSGIQKILSEPDFSVMGAYRDLHFNHEGHHFFSDIQFVKIHKSDRSPTHYEFEPVNYPEHYYEK